MESLTMCKNYGTICIVAVTVTLQLPQQNCKHADCKELRTLSMTNTFMNLQRALTACIA